jgi:UDP-glucose 4-epimerase
VTGGAGYIGSITTRLLLEGSHQVVVLDTLERGYRQAVDPQARLVIGSVGNAESCRDALVGADAVLHCAGLIEVAESQEKPDLYRRVNSEQPKTLLAEMLAAGVETIVFSSTAAVYGEPEAVPIPEDARLAPVNVYGESKLAFERTLDEYAVRGLRSIRLRYFNVAGAWHDGSLGEAHAPETHIIPRILQAVAGGQERFEVFGSDYPTPDGTCVRDYIHVCDLARAHRLALERLVAGGEGGVFNLGNGEGFTNLEVVRACAGVVGREIEVEMGPRRQGDPAVLVASSQRARAELGWAPDQPKLAEMVADAWRWHVAHPHGYA